MKFRQICAAALSAVVLVSGCSKPGTESVDKYTRDGEGRVIPISDEYIPANYTPRSDDWSVMLREIPGSFGQETDKLIPAVYLTTSDPSAIIKEDYADCTVQIDAGMTNGRYESTEVLTGKIRGRGHSTWEWPKKPYKIKLDDKASLLGMSEAKRWVLLANYADESLLRNTAAFEMGPIWDFDLAFGNMYMDNPKYDDWATIGSMDSSSYIGVTWFNYLMTDEDFRNKARTRWNDVRDTMVNAALGAIDAYKPMVIPSAEENFEIWNTLGVANGFQPLTMKNYNTYLDQVLYLRKFINNRAKWIDENL